METDLIVTFKDIIYLILGIVSLSSAIGAGMFYLLKSKFMPRNECTTNQNRCHSQFCTKIDEIKAILREQKIALDKNQEILYRRNVWMAKAFTSIADELKIKLTDMPV